MQSVDVRKLVFAACLAVACSAGSAVAQGPTDFLRRLDENNNGMIDPHELDGRMGGFIRRMAENNPRIDVSRPIPIDLLAAEFERMREERARAGGGGPPVGGGPPGGGDRGGGRGGPWGGGDRGGDRGSTADQGSSAYSPRTTNIEPLVPGFGVDIVSTPPSGFGAEADLFNITITEEDRREAERAFRYYDRNRDGKIDAEEMRRSRYGADLHLYDRNRDGVITLNEMEYRYARRRLENMQDSRNRPAASGGERREEDRRRGGSSREGSGEERSGSRTAAEVRSYRRVPAVERLPAGLPDWFARDDADGDGQISMHEFSSTWTDAVLAEFNQFDLNGDGFITPEECLAAKANGAVRGSSIGMSGRSTTVAAAASSAGEQTAAGDGQAAGPTATATGETLKIDPRYLDYFKKVFAKYDTNNDGELTANEWASMSRDPTPADTDGNGRITFDEFVRWQMKR